MTTAAWNILCLSSGGHSAPFSWVDTWGGTVGSKGRDSSALIKPCSKTPHQSPVLYPALFLSLSLCTISLTSDVNLFLVSCPSRRRHYMRAGIFVHC